MPSDCSCMPEHVAADGVAGMQVEGVWQPNVTLVEQAQVLCHAHFASASSAELAGAARNQESKSPFLSERLMRGSQSSATTAGTRRVTLPSDKIASCRVKTSVTCGHHFPVLPRGCRHLYVRGPQGSGDNDADT